MTGSTIIALMKLIGTHALARATPQPARKCLGSDLHDRAKRYRNKVVRWGGQGCLHRQPANASATDVSSAAAMVKERGAAPVLGHASDPCRRERQREPAAVAPIGAGTGTTRSLPPALASYMAK